MRWNERKRMNGMNKNGRGKMFTRMRRGKDTRRTVDERRRNGGHGRRESSNIGRDNEKFDCNFGRAKALKTEN